MNSSEGTAQKKAEYEGSALQALMESSGHVVCDRCYCCDSTIEMVPCWQCGGFENEDDEWAVPCSVCHDEGRISYRECLGRCDDDGNHEKTVIA